MDQCMPLDALPAPLVPAGVDLRDFTFMPLHVGRLMQSDTWLLASGDEAKAMVSLWCRAWHQTPAGSLPDDDRILAALSGAGQDWKKVREVALRGFIRCADGRLYHPLICDEARKAWTLKQAQRTRTQAARESRAIAAAQRRDLPQSGRQRYVTENVTEDVTTTVTDPVTPTVASNVTETVTESTGTGTGTGTVEAHARAREGGGGRESLVLTADAPKALERVKKPRKIKAVLSGIPDGWEANQATVRWATGWITDIEPTAEGRRRRADWVQRREEEFPHKAREKGWQALDWQAKFRNYLLKGYEFEVRDREARQRRSA